MAQSTEEALGSCDHCGAALNYRIGPATKLGHEWAEFYECGSAVRGTRRHSVYSEDRTKACSVIAGLRDDLAKATRSRRFTEDWYAGRIERITMLAKEHGIWPTVATILANGTASSDEPPTYAQLLNGERHKAERMCRERDALMAYIDRAKIVAQRMGRVTGQPLDHFLEELERHS